MRKVDESSQSLIPSENVFRQQFVRWKNGGKIPNPEMVNVRGIIFGWNGVVIDGTTTPDMARPYPGVAEMLQELRQRDLVTAVLSDQPRDVLLRSAKEHDLLKYFDLVVAVEDVTSPKPNSEPLRHVLRRLKLRPSETLFLGDMSDEIGMGLEVGVITVGVQTAPRQDLSRADLGIDLPTSLLGYLNGTGFTGHLERSITMATVENRQFVEERYRKKIEGELPRIPSWYHADNVAFASAISSWGFVPDRARVADIGCGTSIYSHRIARQYKAAVCRIDLSHLALVQARLHKGSVKEPSSVFNVNSDSARLPLSDSGFDVVICSEMLEHVVDDRAVLEEANRVLKPGGHLVISVPNSPQSTLPLFRRLQRQFNLAGHVREYTGDEMKRLLASNSFDILQTRSSSFFVFWALFSIERSSLAKWIGDLLERRPEIGAIVQRSVACAILVENRLLGSWARFGMRSLYLAQKQTG